MINLDTVMGLTDTQVRAALLALADKCPAETAETIDSVVSVTRR